MMFGLLKPTTLVRIVADLQEAEDESWMGCDQERIALDDALMALVDNVGPEEADRMITAAKETD